MLRIIMEHVLSPTLTVSGLLAWRLRIQLQKGVLTPRSRFDGEFGWDYNVERRAIINN